MTRALNLNTTMYCNARCPFCIVLDRLNRPELNMTDEQIEAALVQARAEGATHAGYSGGEPTIDPRLPGIVRRAREMGFVSQSINTNGIRLKSQALCRELIEAGLTSIDFSIVGHVDELHDRLVDHQGALAAIREACGHLRELKRKFKFHISCTIVVTKENHGDLVAISKLTRDLGIEHVRLKYAYEGHQDFASIVEQVAPFDVVVPSVLAAIDYLASTPGGLAVVHVPLCLLGHRAVFSDDLERRPGMMAFADNTMHCESSQRFREDGDECDRCAVSNLCARLDSGYEKFHGRPKLKPFASREELDRVFDAALVAYPGRATHLGRIRERYMMDRDSARPERVMTEPVTPHPGTPVKLAIPRAPKPG